MYEQVRQIVLDSGLWNDGRISSHGFILSPSIYKIAPGKRAELEAIGIALRECLSGLGRIMSIACDPKLGRNRTWGMIARAFRTGIPAIYHDVLTLNPGNTPSICKVDVMESIEGSYQIAEIDGHNKHGLGYSVLAARIRKVIIPEAQTFPGVALALSEEIVRRGKSDATLLYAEQERFYLPEFHILQNELSTLGVKLRVVAENDLSSDEVRLLIDDNRGEPVLFIDFPFLYYNRQLNTLLAEGYRKGEIDFLIPPKPFLGSKAILALLRNEAGDSELEAILKSQIRSSSLELFRRYIPETHLVSKLRGRTSEEYWRNLCSSKRFVLKESISSGMKGTVFMEDPHFGVMMKRACDSYYRFILQKEVNNHPQIFQYFTDGGSLQQDEWFMRITVHYSLRQIADVIITARRDKKVHGALDCLQLGAVLA